MENALKLRKNEYKTGKKRGEYNENKVVDKCYEFIKNKWLYEGKERRFLE